MKHWAKMGWGSKKMLKTMVLFNVTFPGTFKECCRRRVNTKIYIR